MDILNKAFGEVGAEYGYDSVTAEFCEYKDFKVKWRRSCGWAEFEVSDYLKDAPKEAIEGLARTIFSRIGGRCGKADKKMTEYITSSKFIEDKQPVYIARSRNISDSQEGEYFDLSHVYEALVLLGLVEKDDQIQLRWTKTPNVRRIGLASVLMKVAVVSSLFDSEEIPYYVREFVLYHQLLHIAKGFNPFEVKHDETFEEKERLYPQYEDAQKWLRTMRLYF